MKVNEERFLIRNSDGDEFCLLKRGRKVWFYTANSEGHGSVFSGPKTLRKIADAILETLDGNNKAALPED